MTFTERIIKYGSSIPGSLRLAATTDRTPVYIPDRPVRLNEMSELLSDTALAKGENHGKDN